MQAERCQTDRCLMAFTIQPDPVWTLHFYNKFIQCWGGGMGEKGEGWERRGRYGIGGGSLELYNRPECQPSSQLAGRLWLPLRAAAV